MLDPGSYTATAVCRDLGIQIIPTNVRAKPLQTHARACIQQVIQNSGDGHARFVLRCIIESEGNETELRSETIWAVSDVVLARPDWADRGLEFLEAFDAIDLKALRLRAKRILPRWPARVVLGVLLWERLRLAMGEEAPDCSRLSAAAPAPENDILIGTKAIADFLEVDRQDCKRFIGNLPTFYMPGTSTRCARKSTLNALWAATERERRT